MNVDWTDLSRRNKFVPVKQGSSLWIAADIIAHQGVHRVPVVNNEGKVVNIISQSSLIGFLNDHVHKFFFWFFFLLRIVTWFSNLFDYLLHYFNSSRNLFFMNVWIGTRQILSLWDSPHPSLIHPSFRSIFSFIPNLVFKNHFQRFILSNIRIYFTVDAFFCWSEFIEIVRCCNRHYHKENQFPIVHIFPW